MWRRHLQPESLNLVRVLSVLNSAWISARIGSFPHFISSSRYWVELRDDVLAMYPAGQILFRYRAQHRNDACMSAEQLEQLSPDRVSQLAELVPSEHVTAFVLHTTRFLFRPDSGVVDLKSHYARPPARLQFDSAQTVALWRDGINAVLGEHRKRLSDFKVIRHVGKGASGRVYEVEDKLTAERFALKVIEKTTVFESKDAYRHAMDERLVLQMIRHHPYILDMHYAFQNTKRLFLVTEFCSGGDMFEYMNRRVTPIDESTARFISAQVLLALEHLHELGIVYRDLKLENILLDCDGHIRLADFGLTKILRQSDGSLRRTDTFCGTREYVAPEMLRGDSYDTKLDFWAYGILLYEMLSGRTPFYTSNHGEIYNRIEHASISFPSGLSSEVRNLLSKLLVRDPERRIGGGEEGIANIKAHPWFASMDWEALGDGRSIESPLKESIVFLKRQEELRNRQSSSSMAPRKKDRKLAKQEKALATVLKDVKADLHYAARGKRSSTISQGGRITPAAIKTPMSRHRKTLLAGYSYCDPLRRSQGDGPFMGRLSGGGDMGGGRSPRSWEASVRSAALRERPCDAVGRPSNKSGSEGSVVFNGSERSGETVRAMQSESPTSIRTRVGLEDDVVAVAMGRGELAVPV